MLKHGQQRPEGRVLLAISERPSGMVNVYLVNGHTASVPQAVSVKVQNLLSMGRMRPNEAPPKGLACLDADGKVLGEFQLDQVLGYAIVGE